MKTRSFQLSATALAVVLSFSTDAYAAVFLKGTMTINGDPVEFSSADEANFGKPGDVIEVKKKSGDSFFVNSAKLTLDGARINVEGFSSAAIGQNGSQISIGSEATDYVRLAGCNFGVSTKSGATLTVDSGNEIVVGSIVGNSDVDFAAALAMESNIVIGPSAKKISILAESENRTQKRISAGLKALDGGTIQVGGEAAESILISAKHKTNATAILADVFQATDGSKEGRIDLLGQSIQGTAVSEDQAFGIVAHHTNDVSIGSDATQSVVFSATSTGLKTDKLSRAIAAEAYSQFDNSSEIALRGKHIALSSTAHMEAVGAYASTGGKLAIGSAATEDIRISAVNTQANPESFAFGVWVDNSASLKKGGGTILLQGKTVSIYAEGGTDTRAIHVASNDLNPAARSSLRIDAENILIEAKSGSKTKASETETIGIAAMSAGNVDIVGNARIEADRAILARGDAHVVINKDGGHATQILGDIVFNYDEGSSKTDVDAVVDVTLAGESSFMEGKSAVTGNPPDEKKLVENFSMTIADRASWRVTDESFVNKLTLSDDGSIALLDDAKSFEADEIELAGGIVKTTDAAQQITVKSLSLSEKGGAFDAAASADQEGHLQSAKFIVESAAPAENAVLTVNYNGITADQITDENAKDLAAVSASGIAISEVAQEGDVSGEWSRTTNAAGEAVTKRADNTKLEAFKGVSAAALVQWRNQVNHLTKRLGDVRLQQGDIGAWARVYGGEYKWGSANHVDMKSTTVQAGGDARVGDWIVGGAFSYSDSSFDLSNGDGDGELYSVALYGSRLFDKGSYVDFVARYGYIKNDIKAGNMDVDFDSNAFGVSVETGHTFSFAERAYVEPQIELAYGYAEGDDVTASNGVKISQDDYQNLVARVGLRAGFNFPEDAGTIYAHASYSYDFLGDADGIASKGANRASLDEDLGGGWVTYGIGGQVRLGASTYAFGELERSTGGDVENPWSFNIGLRHFF